MESLHIMDGISVSCYEFNDYFKSSFFVPIIALLIIFLSFAIIAISYNSQGAKCIIGSITGVLLLSLVLSTPYCPRLYGTKLTVCVKIDKNIVTENDFEKLKDIFLISENKDYFPQEVPLISNYQEIADDKTYLLETIEECKDLSIFFMLLTPLNYEKQSSTYITDEKETIHESEITESVINNNPVIPEEENERNTSSNIIAAEPTEYKTISLPVVDKKESLILNEDNSFYSKYEIILIVGNSDYSVEVTGTDYAAIEINQTYDFKVYMDENNVVTKIIY